MKRKYENVIKDYIDLVCRNDNEGFFDDKNRGDITLEEIHNELGMPFCRILKSKVSSKYVSVWLIKWKSIYFQRVADLEDDAHNWSVYEDNKPAEQDAREQYNHYKYYALHPIDYSNPYIN